MKLSGRRWGTLNDWNKGSSNNFFDLSRKGVLNNPGDNLFDLSHKRGLSNPGSCPNLNLRKYTNTTRADPTQQETNSGAARYIKTIVRWAAKKLKKAKKKNRLEQKKNRLEQKKSRLEQKKNTEEQKTSPIVPHPHLCPPESTISTGPKSHGHIQYVTDATTTATTTATSIGTITALATTRHSNSSKTISYNCVHIDRPSSKDSSMSNYLNSKSPNLPLDRSSNKHLLAPSPPLNKHAQNEDDDTELYSRNEPHSYRASLSNQNRENHLTYIKAQPPGSEHEMDHFLDAVTSYLSISVDAEPPRKSIPFTGLPGHPDKSHISPTSEPDIESKQVTSFDRNRSSSKRNTAW